MGNRGNINIASTIYMKAHFPGLAQTFQ